MSEMSIHNYKLNQLCQDIHRKMLELDKLQWIHRLITGRDYIISGKLLETEEKESTNKENKEVLHYGS